jgi:homocitrate synthase NifV
MTPKPKVLLTDTTLRDGEQSCGYALNIESKVALAKMLDNAGFYLIEAGIPAMGSCEKDAICRIMDIRRDAKIAVWNRMRKEDIVHSFDCHPDVIHISAPVSDIMIAELLKTNRYWVIKLLKKCISFAKDKGYEVTVGFQDASRADTVFMAMVANEIAPLGVTAVRLADTVGILTPTKAREMVETLARQTDLDFGIHTHNDLGMAAAVAAEAVKGGAKYVDTTLFGIGERAGNCDSYRFSRLVQGMFDVAPKVESLDKLSRDASGILKPYDNKACLMS